MRTFMVGGALEHGVHCCGPNFRPRRCLEWSSAGALGRDQSRDRSCLPRRRRRTGCVPAEDGQAADGAGLFRSSRALLHLPSAPGIRTERLCAQRRSQPLKGARRAVRMICSAPSAVGAPALPSRSEQQSPGRRAAPRKSQERRRGIGARDQGAGTRPRAAARWTDTPLFGRDAGGILGAAVAAGLTRLRGSPADRCYPTSSSV
jgi:hypothetical protein